MTQKLHLGCGHEILSGFTNVDSAPLPGVDVVHDLRKFPWPFSDGQYDEVIIKHVLEHLPDTIQVMDEIWRVCASNARVTIRIPYWNSEDFITDPTHIKAFNEHSFDFFNPDHPRCKERSYYAKARFRPARRTYFVKVGERYFESRSSFVNGILECLAKRFSNVIQVMEFELTAVK